MYPGSQLHTPKVAVIWVKEQAEQLVAVEHAEQGKGHIVQVPVLSKYPTSHGQVLVVRVLCSPAQD